MEQEKKVILLAGPTASGKSKLAIKLAQHFGGEIINADSMQVYKEISILTSKPNIQDIKIIRHHLYGFKSVKQKFSTGHWLKMVVKKIEKLWKNGRTPNCCRRDRFVLQSSNRWIGQNSRYFK